MSIVLGAQRSGLPKGRTPGPPSVAKMLAACGGDGRAAPAVRAKVNGLVDRDDLPMIVSFYAGDPYYQDAARQLSSDCERLELDHDIVDMNPVAETTDWIALCRRKIAFFREALDRQQRAILWVDVDTRMIRRPEVLARCGFDMAGFVRNGVSLRDFDPYRTGRFWTPTVLYLNRTDETRRFLEHLHALDMAEARAVTDDYLLNEAWRTYGGALSVGVLAPALFALRPSEVTATTVFVHRMSGHVGENKGRVVQHGTLLEPAALVEHAFDATSATMLADGDRSLALGMLRHARRSGFGGIELTLKEAYLARLSGEREAAVALLADAYAKERSPKLLSRMIELAVQDGRLQQARSWLSELPDADTSAETRRVQALRVRLDIEERALALGVTAGQRAPLWWPEATQSGYVGDALNPFLVEWLTGVPPRRAAVGSGLMLVGGSAGVARSGTTICGAGAAHAGQALAPEARYLSVRGPLTRELVLRSGGGCPDIYGDPALMLPQVYQPNPMPRMKLGVVRPSTHKQLPFPLRSDDVRDISAARTTRDEVERFIDEIVSCERIISASLHGVVVAHAYGVPAAWHRAPNFGVPIDSDPWEFDDYFASLGLPRPACGPALADAAALKQVLAAQAFTCPEPSTLETVVEKLRSAAALAGLEKRVVRGSKAAPRSA